MPASEQFLPTIPAPVLAEDCRGPRHAASDGLALAAVESLIGQNAEAVGALAGNAEDDDVPTHIDKIGKAASQAPHRRRLTARTFAVLGQPGACRTGSVSVAR